MANLAGLHELLAQAMEDELKRCKDADLSVSAPFAAVIAKFLKDNNVTAEREDMDELAKLREQLEGGRASARAVLLSKAQEELDDLGKGLLN